MQSKMYQDRRPLFFNKTRTYHDTRDFRDSGRGGYRHRYRNDIRGFVVPPQTGIKRYETPPAGKYWWRDTKMNHNIAAGGILILDEVKNSSGETEEGAWVVAERTKKGTGLEYSDFGGRYHYDDCDIYATIAREFREEVYNTDEIPYKTIRELCEDDPEENKFVYRMTKGKYFCLVVHRSYLPELNLDNEKFLEAKVKALTGNPYVSTGCYRSESIVFLPFSRLAQELCPLSYRLDQILKKSRLKNKIEFFSQQTPRSPPSSDRETYNEHEHEHRNRSTSQPESLNSQGKGQT